MILCPTKISPKNKHGGSDIESEDQKALSSVKTRYIKTLKYVPQNNSQPCERDVCLKKRIPDEMTKTTQLLGRNRSSKSANDIFRK